MSAGVLVAAGSVAALVAANVITTRRLWASSIFEAGQKIAQTVLVWLVPGSFFLVRHVLGEQRARRAFNSSDPTQSPDRRSPYGDAAAWTHHHSWDTSGGGSHGGGFGDGGGGDAGGGS